MVLALWVLGFLVCLLFLLWQMEYHERHLMQKQAANWESLYRSLSEEIDEAFPLPPLPRRWR
jgi:hypothetical protein